jgi:hypothetical protein
VHLSKFRVVNYKSFADSGDIHLEPGFNVIVGRNNVGKTALAEAMSLRFPSKPHRSTDTVPSPGTSLDQASRAEVSIRVEANELLELLLREMPTFYVPTDNNNVTAGQEMLKTALSEGVTVDATYINGGYHNAKFSNYEDSLSHLVYLRVTMDSSSNLSVVGPIYDLPSDYPVLATALATKFHERLYSFSAVRFDIDEHPISINRILAPNASDLMQVLDLLSRNPSRWQRYLQEVQTVVPEIKAITFIPSERVGGSVRAQLWSIDPDTEREDLAVPLSESGTGIGQVLAIFYVVFTSEYPRAIVIDEPQSFLHPGAIRKLFEILKGYPQHQYTITTHSPNAVTAADPKAIFLVRKEEEESVVEQLDVAETRHQTRFLREVGASLSDVFGADDILWVEGPTEEECFPLILKKVANRRLMGTKITAIVQTGDFESKHSDTILEVYRRLSEGGGLLPPAVGFIFDREDRDEEARKDLERRSDGKVVFTKRRMYENYLLNPCAIAAVVSEIEGFSEAGDIKPKDINVWLEQHRWDRRYFHEKVKEDSQTEETWLSDVHGAKVLDEMFQELSETRVLYDKVVHGMALTRWLCDNAPDDLRELASVIEDQLKRHVRQ